MVVLEGAAELLLSDISNECAHLCVCVYGGV
jgi:hypothetical protein